MKKILFLTPFIPLDKTSGPQGEKNLTMNLLSELIKVYDVDLFVVSEDSESFHNDIYIEYKNLKNYFHFKTLKGRKRFYSKINSLRKCFPPTIGIYKNNDAIRRLNEIVYNYDIIHYDYFLLSEYFKITYRKKPSLLYAHDAYSLNHFYMLKEENLLKVKIKYLFKYFIFLNHEKKRYKFLDKIITVSQNDTNYLLSKKINDVYVLNNFIKSDFLNFDETTFNKSNIKILFNAPCINEQDKILFDKFHKKYLNELLEKNVITEVVFWGKNVSNYDNKSDNPKVKYIKFVDDYKGFLQEKWIYIYLRNVGSGQHGKVLDAMALGLPIIGFKNIMTAFDFKDKKEVLIVDDLSQILKKVDLLIETDLLEKLRKNAYSSVKNNFTEKSVLEKISPIYESLLCKK